MEHLRSAHRKPQPVERPRRVFEEVWYEGPTSRKAVVTREWHLIRNLVPEDTIELYDQIHDPDEEHDRAGDGDPAEAALGAELAAWMDAIALPSDFQTSERVTASTAGVYTYDLGLDYFSKYPSKLSAVTAGQAKAAAEKYLVPERLIVVAVGDRARIGALLQKLNLGAVEVRNADATLVKSATGTSHD